MDDYMFRSYVKDCKTVAEATSYLEVLNYSVSLLSTSTTVYWFFDLRVTGQGPDSNGELVELSMVRRELERMKKGVFCLPTLSLSGL
jgi:hypothetical protein